MDLRKPKSSTKSFYRDRDPPLRPRLRRGDRRPANTQIEPLPYLERWATYRHPTYDRGCLEKNCNIGADRSSSPSDLSAGSGILTLRPRPPGPARPYLMTYREQRIAKQRPGKGKEGRVAELRVNHFPVSISDKHERLIYYDVCLKPPCSVKEVNRELKSLIQENFTENLIAYDGLANLYIPESVVHEHFQFAYDDRHIFHVRPWAGGTAYTMIFRKVKAIGPSGLLGFVGGCTVRSPRVYLRALDTAVRDSLSWIHGTADKSSYFDDHGSVDLDLNESCCRFGVSGSILGFPGFSLGLCPLQCGLTLNLDTSAQAFHARKCVYHYLQGRGIDPRMLLLEEGTFREAEEKLIGLYVDSTHRKNWNKYKIVAISRRPAAQDGFFDNRRQRQTKVVEYFESVAGTNRIDHHLPCLIVRGPGGHPDWTETETEPEPFYLPMDLCLISKGQVFTGHIPDTQRLRLQDLAIKCPRERYRTIKRSGKYVNDLLHREQKVENKRILPIDPFGLKVEPTMMTVTGRVLEQPALMNVKTEYPRGGDWELSKVCTSGRPLSPHQLGVIGLNSTADSDWLKAIAGRVFQRCESMGMVCFKELQNETNYYTLDSSMLNDSSLLDSCLLSLTAGPLSKAEFLLCVIGDHDGSPLELSFNRKFKPLCETKYGWITQCCFSENIEKGDDAYLTDVALKLNAKLGGTNNALCDGFATLFRSVFQDLPVIIFGVEVHASTVVIRPKRRSYGKSEGELEDSVGPLDDPPRSTRVVYDVAAVAASMDWPHPSQYCARASNRRKKSKEGQLSSMVDQLLRVHIERNGDKPPERVVFFSHGVRDGDFLKLLNREFEYLKQTLEKRCRRVRVTWIVVREKHNTVFFRGGLSCKFEGTLDAGTVVDSDVVHPWQWDFYLASRTATGMDTLQTTNYTVLEDENEFSADDVERFVYYLCHTHATCRKTVEVVPPLAYARLAIRHALSYRAITGERDDPPSGVIDTMYFLT